MVCCAYGGASAWAAVLDALCCCSVCGAPRGARNGAAVEQLTKYQFSDAATVTVSKQMGSRYSKQRKQGAAYPAKQAQFSKHTICADNLTIKKP